jgi:primosomal protein N' (replication factor Y) (superfamily II helicase)
MPYVDVAVNTTVYKTYHYHIPDDLLGRIQPGHLVRVSFGTAMQPAIVLTLMDETPIRETKPVLDLLDPDPVMTPQHLQLGLWMSAVYLTSPGAALWLMLPPGLTGQSVQTVHLLQPDVQRRPGTPKDIIDALWENGGPLSAKQLEKRFGATKARSAIAKLADEGIVWREAHLTQPTARPKTVKTLQRLFDPATLDALLADLSKQAHKQRRILHHIAQQASSEIDAADLNAATNATSQDIKRLVDKGLLAQSERISYRDTLADRDYVPNVAPPLTPEQQRVWDAIKEAGRGAKFLLHGVTGSGKTEIYLRAIAETLAQGRQAILLVPEIALTPQTIRRVAQRFPGQVAVVHGSLSVGERYDTWQRARNGEIPIIVGTRSAIFTPLPDIGLIVMDEEHDHSYKHQPPFNPPYYHARAVAERIVALNDAALILGSATPDVSTRYRADKGELTYLHMPSRIMGHRQRVQEQAKRLGVEPVYQPDAQDALSISLPPVEIVDMRDELKADNRSIFSRSLRDALTTVLEREEQAILFLNRRGQATYVFCRDCGYVFACPRCDTPLTHHSQGEHLRCHHCNYEMPTPRTCPECQSQRVKFFGAGTQHVEKALKAEFPGVRSVRWDADTASKATSHEEILQQFIDHDADVMIGTQMVAKGLDLPLVTLVGVVSADPGLFLPDFRAGERAFQLLTQVAGRAGRGILGGQVILQTYQPEHDSIRYAAEHDYTGFYAQEIIARRELGYPPFRKLARILIQSSSPVEAQRQAESAKRELVHLIDRHKLTDTGLIGPAPCFLRKIDRVFRWQILIRSHDPLTLLRGFRVQKGWYVDLDALDVL